MSLIFSSIALSSCCRQKPKVETPIPVVKRGCLEGLAKPAIEIPQRMAECGPGEGVCFDRTNYIRLIRMIAEVADYLAAVEDRCTLKSEENQP